MTRSVIQIRVAPADKQAMTSRAAREGLCLSAWIRSRCIESKASLAEMASAERRLCPRCASLGYAACLACQTQ